MREKENKIWVGSNQGLFVFSDINSIPQHFSTKTHTWFPDDEILSIYQDNNGIIWLGTRNAGLFSVNQRNVFDEKGLQFKQFKAI